MYSQLNMDQTQEEYDGEFNEYGDNTTIMNDSLPGAGGQTNIDSGMASVKRPSIVQKDTEKLLDHTNQDMMQKVRQTAKWS